MNINIEREVQTVLKEGFLDKQSRIIKSWRRLAIYLFSRWFVLTPQCLLTFKDRKVYTSPTEIIPLKTITSIKSSEEEISK